MFTQTAKMATNILIVDDEIEQIKSLRLSLRSKGYQVTAVTNAAEALTVLRDGRHYDLVLTDYAMPEVNGLEFLQEIRKAGKDIAVIMMTAYGEKEVLVDALRSRCDGFIEKPFTIDELVAEITHVVALKNSMLETTRKALADFVPMMVHQINNPLTAISGNAELALLRSPGCEKTRTSLHRIIEATAQIKSINQEILELGKGLDKPNECIDLKSIVHGCLESFEAFCQMQDVTIKQTLPASSCWITGNRFSLEQVFRNLVHNAVDAMEKSSEKMLLVELRRGADNAVQIEISDTGCGIPAEDMPNLFKPYFSTKQKGTGLGLSVVRRVVMSHNGDISVRSTVGEGTRFSISLPIFTDSLQEADNRSNHQKCG